MANITDVRTSTNIAQARIVVDMAEKIAQLNPSEAPFVTLLKLAKKDKRTAYSPKFEWLEDDILANTTAVNGAVAETTATSITVDDASILRVGDIIKVPVSGECMLVTAISSNTLSVVRGYGSTAAAAIADDAEVLIIGSAMPENSRSRDVRSTSETNAYNYTQIFRTPVALSGTEAAAKLYGGRDRAYQRHKAAIEHKRDIAMSMYFGERKLDTTGSTPRRTMGGIIEFLKNGSQTQAFSSSSGGTALTYDNFNKLVAKKVFQYGSDEKLLICGPEMITAIDSWALAKNQLQQRDKEKTFGLHITELYTSFGKLNVMYDPLLKGTTYGGYAMALDMDNIRYVALSGRDTKLNVDIQDNDVDGVMDEYITECSIEVKLPKTHMLLTGCYTA